MLKFNFKCNTQEEMFEKKEAIHDALVGSPAYINSEIAVCDVDDITFTLVIGELNDNNAEFDFGWEKQ